jgi:hypothetical protein
MGKKCMSSANANIGHKRQRQKKGVKHESQLNE